MKGWFRKSGRVTADTARRITGISIPFGGLQWADPGPGDAELVRHFLVFMEDRRVLYNGMDLEVVSQVERSIGEIREACTKTLQALPASSFAVSPIRAVRAAGRRFHNDRNEEFRHFDNRWQHDGVEPGVLVALGAYRAAVGYQAALLAAHYDLDVEGELASIMPSLDGEAS